MDYGTDPEEPFFSARDLQRWRWREGAAPHIAPPVSAIFCLPTDLARRARRRLALKPVKGLFGECWLVKNSRSRVALAEGIALGAPATAILVEEYAALGALRLLSLGTAGTLQPELRSGDVVVCTQALRGEGTSAHYLAPAPWAEPDGEMVRSLCAALTSRRIPFSSGPSWTTDAPYRETRREVAAHRQEGILTVEMEAAALFAAARRLKVQAAAVFVVADRLLPAGWEPPETMTVVQESLGTVLEAAVAWLGGEGE